MEYLSEAQTQLLREQFPSIADLRNQVPVTYWSEQHLVTQELLDLLPFSRILSAMAFYHYTDFQLDDLVAEAQRNLVLWVLTGVHQYNSTLVNNYLCFTTTPSSGIIAYLRSARKSSRTSNKGIEFDFYPDFTSRKPKLNWSLVRSALSTTAVNPNLFIPTARITRTIGSPASRILA